MGFMTLVFLAGAVVGGVGVFIATAEPNNPNQVSDGWVRANAYTSGKVGV